MKAFRLIGMAIVAMCLCMNFASCSNEDVVAPEEEKYVTVGLGCTGEFLEFSESAMGRAATDELYGIQVYALTESGKHENGTPYYSETPYAYGVYTSLDNVKIRLLQGQKYKFKVGIVVDPYKYDINHISCFFGEELNSNATEFNYSSSEMVCADYSPSNCSEDFIFFHDRYYGELDVYTPTENSTVDIHTKRVAYGVKYETIDLATDERFIIEVSGQYSSYKLYSVEVGIETLDDIYTFQNINSAWYSRNIDNEEILYTSRKNLTISWNKADGTVVPMGTYSVTFKRNVKTTIRIKAEANDLENGIKVYKEEKPMADDEYIYDITGGKVEEVPVNSGN